ncbi:unnamed protein product [Caenorhabditis brenneri]
MSSDIPRRTLTIWETPLAMSTCGLQLNKHKLQCSECQEQFDNMACFAIHIEKCHQEVDKKDLNYKTHQYANRLISTLHEIQQICGNTWAAPVLTCPICKDEFEDEETTKYHISACWNYEKQYKEFLRKFRPLFQNLEVSHVELGLCFQQYILNSHNVTVGAALQTKNGQKMSVLSTYFHDKERAYRLSLNTFVEEMFLRYLIRLSCFEISSQLEYLPMMDEKREEMIGETQGSEGEEADDEFSDGDYDNGDEELDVVN